MSNLPSFDDVSNALMTLSSLGTAGESHGLLCALLSFNNKIRDNAWVDSLLASHIEANDTQAQEAYRLLSDLFKQTAEAFRDEEAFDFPILIPDDDISLEDRVDGLAEWCQGYLTGLHLMGIKLDDPNYSPDLKEALDDLLAISQVEFTSEDAEDKESEVRFMQLLEHVKASVLTISQELKSGLSESENNTIH